MDWESSCALAVTEPSDPTQVSLIASNIPENNRCPVPSTVRSIDPTEMKMPELMGRMETVMMPAVGLALQAIDN